MARHPGRAVGPRIGQPAHLPARPGPPRRPGPPPAGHPRLHLPGPVIGAPLQYPFPGPRPAALPLHDLLISLYPRPQAALLLAAQAGIDVTWINGGQAIAPLWKDILEAAAGGARLRALVGAARDRLHPEHPARAFLDDLLAD